MRQDRSQLLKALAAGVAVTYAFWRAALLPAPSPDGQTPPDRVLDEGLRACQALAPSSGHLTLAFDRTEARPSHLATWNLVATDTQGRDVVTMSWAAGTGELLSVAFRRTAAVPSRAPRLGAADAVLAAWRWMKVLGVDRYASHWNLCRPPLRPSLVWATRWQADGHFVYVTVDSRTGELAILTHSIRQAPAGSDPPCISCGRPGMQG